jgi:4-hydroxy-tetrahydrodipicolinate reductase
MSVGLTILGARGRMGDALLEAITTTPGAVLAGATERAGHADLGALLADTVRMTDDVTAALSTALVGIDFSAPAALQRHLDTAVSLGRALVIGTTGFEPSHDAAITRAAQHIPILQAANMSLGVTLLAALVRQAAAALGPDWDIEIAEMHHRHKVDAPSGTALLLGRAAAQGRGVHLSDVELRGRDGITGSRPAGGIGFASLRGGSVAGDHQVIFAGDQERVELGHRADSRAIFARGAVKAALWLAGKPAGRYRMEDVLGLA